MQLEPLASLAESFAADEHLGEGVVGPLARLWRHGRAIVPGLRDMRLPAAQTALESFRAQGYEVHLRSSGGRLVVLDEGVLNVAIAYSGEQLPSVEDGFHLMADVLAGVLRRLGLAAETGEIPGSICSGRYDIAIAGRKVAGLSQRRRRTFALIHAFLLVAGTGEERLRQAATFYELAGAAPEDGVRSGTMAALAEVRAGLTVTEVADAVRQVLQES